MTKDYIERRRQEAISRQKLMKENRTKWWKADHIFTSTDDIPEVPLTDDEERKFYIQRLIDFGAIQKKDLIPDHVYLGSCRNTTIATWNGTFFTYSRRKFGMDFDDTIVHFEDDDGFDIFVPIRDITKGYYV